MSIGGDKSPLFDINSEDDHLIDSQLDRASFDLRLSISYDSTMKTPRPRDLDEHLRDSNAGRNDEFKSRQSLAWDSAFFTSAGILDLKELSLVNEGFKNPDQNQRRKICEKGNLRGKLASGERQEPFLDFRVNGKNNLQSSKYNTREPTTNISLASRTRMKCGQQLHPQTKITNQQSSRTPEMSSARKQDHHLRPPKVQTRASGHVASTAVSPRSAFSKNISSTYTNNVHSSAGKRWLSKSLDFKGDIRKQVGNDLDVNGIETPHKWTPIDCNMGRVSEKPQLRSSMKQNIAKGKRSLSPLPGDVMNSSKKPSRLCMPSQRLGLFELDQSATQSAKKVQILNSVSPEPRGQGVTKDYEASRGLKKEVRKTPSRFLAKKTRSVDKDDEKENTFYVEKEKFHGGLANKEYADITSLFDGLEIEPKGNKRKKASTPRYLGSAPTLRPKTKQSNKASTVVEGRDSPFRRSAFISMV